MSRITAACAMALASCMAPCAAIADEKPNAEAAPQETATAAETAADDGELDFKLPPGFKTKKRGKVILYCKTDTPLGTRFKQETCLNDEQMRDYLIALEENKSNVDRIRAICSNPCACGQPDAC